MSTVEKPPVLSGPRVILRPAQLSDLYERLAIGDDPEFNRLLGDVFEDVRQWHNAISLDPYGWIIEIDGHLAGYSRLHRISFISGTARIAIGLFLESDRGRGIGTEATRLMLKYAFEDLGLKLLELKVLTENERAIACYKKCGFVRDRSLRFEGSRDVIWMTLSQNRYKELAPIWTSMLRIEK